MLCAGTGTPTLVSCVDYLHWLLGTCHQFSACGVQVFARKTSNRSCKVQKPKAMLDYTSAANLQVEEENERNGKKEERKEKKE